jgi:hypothetical protein
LSRYSRDGEFAAQVEQVVLDMEQRGADVLGQIRFGQQQADMGIQLVHVADRDDAQAVLADRLPSPRPVVPASPVRVAILDRRLPMPVSLWSVF